MKLDVVKKLNLLNQNFYTEIGQYFNHTRNYSWEGWDKLLENIKLIMEENDLDVLDLGCGNARFLEFLLKQEFITKSYFGLDNSDFLLEKATEKVSHYNYNSFEFLKTDLLFEDWKLDNSQRFSLITIFGVLHHIPSLELRLSFLEKAKEKLTKNGLIVFTTWNFARVERLKKRIVDLDSEIAQNLFQKIQLEKIDLDSGDYILDWVKGQVSYRYSHYYSDSEVLELLKKTKLKLVEKFVADGRESNVNTYYIVKQ